MGKKLTTEEFIEKARLVHGDKYDYSKTIYNGRHNKLTIICPIHGEFVQDAGSHLLRCGCPSCGRRTTINTRVVDFSDFLTRANNIHGDKYDYSKVIYKNITTPIEITCKKCGNEFMQKPSKHTLGNGCPKCARKEASTKKTIWDEDKVIGVSKKYRYRADFMKNESGAYKFARKYNLLGCMVWHEAHPSVCDNGRYIYVYIDEHNRVVYVGITLRKKERHIQHKTRDDSAVYRYFNGLNMEIPHPIYVEKNLNPKKAQEMENYWINYYKSKGYTILNKGKTGVGCGSLGGNTIKWTKEKCIKEAMKYTTLKLFRENSGGAHGASRKNKWLNEYTWLKKREKKPSNYWNKKHIKEASSKCLNITSFSDKYGGAFHAAKKMGILDELFPKEKAIV